MSCEKTLRRQLQVQGLRFTSQRATILDVLHQLDTPATADEVFNLAQTDRVNVDISTVYRTLELFQKLSIVSGYDPGDGKRRYEHVGIEQPHHHLVCRECGCVISISVDLMLPLIQEISAMHSFLIDPDGLTITGLCAVCQHNGSTGSHTGRTTSYPSDRGQ